MPMKKLSFITTLLLINLHAFAGGGFSRLSTDTMALLVILGIILVLILGYLFFHAYLEYFFRNKEIEKIHEDDELDDSINEEIRKDSNSKKSDELLNLFMLKRRGVISEREYQQLKERLIRKQA